MTGGRCWIMIGVGVIAGCGGLAEDDPERPAITDPSVVAPGLGGQGGATVEEPEPPSPPLEPVEPGPPAVSYGVFDQSCEGFGDVCRGHSCCEHIAIPGGEHFTSLDWKDRGGLVTVGDFALDKFEVTANRWANFVAHYEGPPPEGAGTSPHIPGSGWRAKWDEFLPAAGDSEPFAERRACLDEAGVVEEPTQAAGCITWYEAFAFCVWDGRRLATTAEWEYAVRGGGWNWAWPWGDEPKAGTADREACHLADLQGCGGWEGEQVRVGRYPQGAARWGHEDMVGNAWWEWVLDDDDDWPWEGKEMANPVGLLDDASGGWRSNAAVTVAWQRDGRVVPRVGFRCAGPAL